jgi:hypothetical protein
MRFHNILICIDHMNEGEGFGGICREGAIVVGYEKSLPSFPAIMKFP